MKFRIQLLGNWSCHSKLQLCYSIELFKNTAAMFGSFKSSGTLENNLTWVWQYFRESKQNIYKIEIRPQPMLY